MGYTKPDPYNQPKLFGLTPVASVDWYGSEACYEFSTTEVWWNEDEKQFYWADDAGCSCNAPFENFEEGDLSSGSWSDVMKHLNTNLGDNPRDEIAADVVDCLQAVMRIARR